jgi:CHAD domain-containing protein
MAKSPYNITPDATFKDAATTAIRFQLDEMLRNLPGTRAGDDIEALHDMRVASRRLRAALSVFVDVFPPKKFAALEKEVARVTDALGAVRDADVQIEFMEHTRDDAPESGRVGLDALIAHLRYHRDAERIHLVKALNTLEKSRFKRDFDSLLDAAEGDK